MEIKVGMKVKLPKTKQGSSMHGNVHSKAKRLGMDYLLVNCIEPRINGSDIYILDCRESKSGDFYYLGDLKPYLNNYEIF